MTKPSFSFSIFKYTPGLVLFAFLQLFTPPAHASDVAMFGAKCDGQTDDQRAITAAIQAAQRSHEKLFFAGSTKPCMLSTAIIVPDGVTLEARPGSVIIQATQDNHSTPMLMGVGSDVVVSGLTFDGGGRDHPNGANIIQGYRVEHTTFESITVRHTRGVAIVMSTGIANTLIRNSSFFDIGNHWETTGRPEDRGQGVVFCCNDGNHGNTATGNKFAHIGLDALQFTDQDGFEVSGNVFQLSQRQLTELSAADYPAAIFLMRSSRGRIVGNTIKDAPGNCIDAPGLRNSAISLNTIDGCGNVAIGLFSTANYGGPFWLPNEIIITLNEIASTGRWQYAHEHGAPLFIAPGASRVSIENNRFGVKRTRISRAPSPLTR